MSSEQMDDLQRAVPSEAAVLVDEGGPLLERSLISSPRLPCNSFIRLGLASMTLIALLSLLGLGKALGTPKQLQRHSQLAVVGQEWAPGLQVTATIGNARTTSTTTPETDFICYNQPWQLQSVSEEGLIPLPCGHLEWYATLIYGSDTSLPFLPALKVLASSLQAANSSRMLVVLSAEAPSSELLGLAVCMGFVVQQIPPIPNSFIWKAKTWDEKMRWAGVFAKLAVFRLAAKRVIYLDLDMVVLRNIDELFAVKPAFQAVRDSSFARDDFNSGLMVLTPSANLYQELSATLKAQNVPAYYLDGGDQGFLNWCFRGEWHIGTSLPLAYNTLKLEERWHRKFDVHSISVLHLCGSHKPWDPRWASFNRQSTPQSYHIWFQAWDLYVEKYAEKCYDSDRSLAMSTTTTTTTTRTSATTATTTTTTTTTTMTTTTTTTATTTTATTTTAASMKYEAAPTISQNEIDAAVELFTSPGMQKAEAAGLQLSDEAVQALLKIPMMHASQILEAVSEKHATPRDPSSYIVSTIAKGFVPRGPGGF